MLPIRKSTLRDAPISPPGRRSRNIILDESGFTGLDATGLAKPIVEAKVTRRLVLLALSLASVLSSTLLAEDDNSVYAEVKDDPSLPRVLLIGDSISEGYTIPTRHLLEGRANLHRIHTNGGNTAKGLQNLADWLGSGNWTVIHFNFGLHDLILGPDGSTTIPLPEYDKNLRAIVAALRKSSATLIWASTTPVPEIKTGPPRKSTDVIAYNGAAKRIMEENRIEIDDLYGYALPQLGEIQLPGNVHFTPQGYEVLAKQVATSILAALKEHSKHGPRGGAGR